MLKVMESMHIIKKSKMVFECKKIYRGTIEANEMIDLGIDEKNYPNKDYHYVYIGKIEKVLVK